MRTVSEAKGQLTLNKDLLKLHDKEKAEAGTYQEQRRRVMVGEE